MVGPNVPEELFSRVFDATQVGEIEHEEHGFMSRLFLQLFDRTFRLPFVARSDVHFCVMREECLNEHTQYVFFSKKK